MAFTFTCRKFQVSKDDTKSGFYFRLHFEIPGEKPNGKKKKYEPVYIPPVSIPYISQNEFNPAGRGKKLCV